MPYERAVRHARSRPQFGAKRGTVVAEADYCCIWLVRIHDTAVLKPERIKPLLHGAEELTKIFSAAGKSATRDKANENNPRSSRET